ncbi:hypothetical protein BAU15_02925 [Enterococcus sp. JM4C]|uniref:glycoside hydrolase family 88/105 protein n=1 Tax=Candidatus Enterococcus huntleyi TaxID=1857217 RepID=UPI00137A3BEE|nr:glycoside hydrolase family 88 protein [Enterococcus sp. JM4C]KAF1299612.1 hypothetical protein BAU15_02925 [Enterococcus sp. JM4C]
MRRDRYFDEKMSGKEAFGADSKGLIEALLKRFIGENPATPLRPTLQYPSYHEVDRDGSVSIDLNQLFPDASIGSDFVAESFIYSFEEMQVTLQLWSYGPILCHINKEIVFDSKEYQENFRVRNEVTFTLKKGENHLNIYTEKTPMGCGFKIGTTNTRWVPIYFYQSKDKLGFKIRHLSKHQKTVSIIEATDEQHDGLGTYLLKIPVEDPYQTFQYRGTGQFYKVMDGQKELIVNGQKESLESTDGYSNLLYTGKNFFMDSLSICLTDDEYEDENLDKKIYYCGPIDETITSESFKWSTLHQDPKGEQIYWRSFEENRPIRMLSQTPLFGYWNYPMGVSLYGMYETANFFGNQEIGTYVQKNIQQIKEYYNYCKWDRDNYNFLGIHSHFYWMEELDDCGSFGSTFLKIESTHDGEIEKDDEITKEMTGKIAYHILEKQKRESDGAFSRYNDTMWADDLYMSVPFLVSYYKASGDERYLEDSISQFCCFKKRMFIEETKLMSHIFDTRTQTANLIPWSRGNGWVLFSLSELLDVLPESNRRYELIKDFYNQMIEGVLAVQDESGLWNQVLDETFTYLESSSTAMFICAMARGIRKGYLDSQLNNQALVAVEKAWQGLASECIDQFGNLYGTCQGSGFSFSRRYYKQLNWRKNDTHGIGIVALAGVERLKLIDYEKSRRGENNA